MPPSGTAGEARWWKRGRR